jgi:hypothetical protein
MRLDGCKGRMKDHRHFLWLPGDVNDVNKDKGWAAQSAATINEAKPITWSQNGVTSCSSLPWFKRDAAK